MSEMVEECGNCKFWRPRTDHTKDMGGGYCVRFPPAVPSSFTVLRGDAHKPFEVVAGTRLNDAWPNVHQQSWCGEYRAPSTVVPGERK